MFKVICINAKPIDGKTYHTVTKDIFLKEGETYTVIEVVESVRGNIYYWLKECPINKEIAFGFHSDRFIPLSNIDENELANTYTKLKEEVL